MNMLNNPLEFIADAAEAIEQVQDLLDSGDERQDNRRLRPKAVLIAVVILATLLFLLMSYLTRGLAEPGPAAASASVLDERTLPKPHSAWFKDCAAARAARAAPLLDSQSAYRPGLDDDGDGVACESGETGLS